MEKNCRKQKGVYWRNRKCEKKNPTQNNKGNDEENAEKEFSLFPLIFPLFLEIIDHLGKTKGPNEDDKTTDGVSIKALTCPWQPYLDAGKDTVQGGDDLGIEDVAVKMKAQ